MKALLKILMALALGMMATASLAGEDIQIRDPWVQAAPPNAKVMAAYLEIGNNGKKPWVLTGVSSPAFEQVGIHRTVLHGNMAHMEHLKELNIPAEAQTTFKPGGLHLMLMDAKKPLRVGDEVPLTLIFKGGKEIEVKATVRSSQAGEKEERQHMDHSGHGSHKH